MNINRENHVLDTEVIAEVMGMPIEWDVSSHSWLQILAKANRFSPDQLPNDITPEQLKHSIRVHLDDAIVTESREDLNYSLFALKQ